MTRKSIYAKFDIENRKIKYTILSPEKIKYQVHSNW